MNAIIDRCLAAMRDQGWSLEQCLALYPAERAQLEPLLSLAARLQGAQSLRASPEFKERALLRLRSQAAAPTSQPVLKRRKPSLPRSKYRIQPGLAFRWAATALVILVIAFMGTLAASARALPGDLLYPVKRAQEQVRLTLTTDVVEQAGLHLEYANRRIAEAAVLIERGQTQALDQVLADYQQRLTSEGILLQSTGEQPSNQQAELASQILEEMNGLENQLNALSSQAPPAAQDDIQSALAVTLDVQNQAVDILNTPDDDSQPMPTRPVDPTPTQTLPPRSSPTPKPPQATAIPTSQVDPGSSPTRTASPTLSPSIWATATETRVPPEPTATQPPVTNTPSISIATLASTSTKPPAADIVVTPPATRTPSPTTPGNSAATRLPTKTDANLTATPQVIIHP
jgi:hypothetical protein